MIHLKCLAGDAAGRVFEIDEKSILLGRSPECDVRLDDPACSRRHCSIERVQGNYVIHDLESRNGVRVNGDRVARSNLGYGDRFQIGGSIFLFLTDSFSDSEDPDLDTMIDNTTTLSAAERQLLRAGQATISEPNPRESSAEEVEELQKVNRQMRAVYLLSRALNGTLKSQELYQLITDNIFSTFKDVERACVFILDDETQTFVRVRSQSRTDTEDSPVSRAVLLRVQRARTGILASDALTDDRFEASATLAHLRVRSLMCVPLTSPDRVLGAIYVENCQKPSCFEKTDLELLTVFGNQAAMAIQNALLYEELEETFYETIRSLSKALEAKDKYTRGHSARVARYAVGIGRELGLEEKSLENLRIASELHDIGKIAIDESIINCSRKLSDEEYEVIKKHPDHGIDILRPIQSLQCILPIVRHHHERYNGEGYPDQLAGEAIPLGARILNLADAFDAMTTQRSYNVPKSFEEAIGVCKNEAGVSFDAECVAALCRFLEKEGRRKKARRGRLSKTLRLEDSLREVQEALKQKDPV